MVHAGVAACQEQVFKVLGDQAGERDAVRINGELLAGFVFVEKTGGRMGVDGPAAVAHRIHGVRLAKDVFLGKSAQG